MSKDYSIESLSEVFSDHAEKFDRDSKRNIEEYKIKYPDQDLPEHMKENFNLAQALSLICKEIIIIKAT
jgi:hypothetical protein